MSNYAYFKESFRILIRRGIEYKINFYSFSFVSLMYFLTGGVFISAMYLNFKDLIGWSLEAFIFYLVFLNGAKSFLAQFSSYKHLRAEILSGRLNSLITKPKNILSQHIFNSSNLFGSFDLLFYSILIITLLISNSYLITFDRLVLTFLFSFLGFVFHFLLFRTVESTVFFIKNNFFIEDFFVQPYRAFTNYPAVMFDGKIKNFAYLMPNVFYGAYATSFLFGYMNYLEFFKLSIILFTLVLIFGFLLLFFWKKGLEKYEAFG